MSEFKILEPSFVAIEISRRMVGAAHDYHRSLDDRDPKVLDLMVAASMIIRYGIESNFPPDKWKQIMEWIHDDIQAALAAKALGKPEQVN